MGTSTTITSVPWQAIGPRRLFFAVRARFARTPWPRPSPLVCGQVVILGAGLDTFALSQSAPGLARLRGRPPRHPSVETRTPCYDRNRPP